MLNRMRVWISDTLLALAGVIRPASSKAGPAASRIGGPGAADG